jgi:hypothetical protein
MKYAERVFARLGNMPVAYSPVSQDPKILASDPLLKEGGSRRAADG